MPIDFYRVQNLQKGDGKLTCTITYNSAHPIFLGHFPGQPVVPGVCTMDMIKDLLEEALDQKLLLRSTGQVKFLQLILPQACPNVSIAWELKDEGYKVAAELRTDTATIFKMNADFVIA